MGKLRVLPLHAKDSKRFVQNRSEGWRFRPNDKPTNNNIELAPKVQKEVANLNTGVDSGCRRINRTLWNSILKIQPHIVLWSIRQLTDEQYSWQDKILYKRKRRPKKKKNHIWDTWREFLGFIKNRIFTTPQLPPPPLLCISQPHDCSSATPH